MVLTCVRVALGVRVTAALGERHSQYRQCRHRSDYGRGGQGVERVRQAARPDGMAVAAVMVITRRKIELLRMGRPRRAQDRAVGLMLLVGRLPLVGTQWGYCRVVEIA